MKQILLFVLLSPIVVWSQKIKINEFDKFVKQKRIEFEPLTVYSTPKAKVTLSLNSIGSKYFITISGFGWGVSTISFDNEAIFLLSNDSTIIAKSTGTQMYDYNNTVNTYKHQYSISLKDVEMLMRHQLVGIRKYNIQDFSDLEVQAQYSDKVKQMGAMFINELYNSRVLLALQNINEKDIGKHIGDSVRLCTRINSTSYFEMAANKPILLNAGTGNNHLFSAVILEQDRPKFNKTPEIIYSEKDVCLTGVVQANIGSKPQIILRDRDQIVIKTPIAVEQVDQYIGDSITVIGTVHNGLYFTESESAPTVLNMGAPYPDPLLAAVITGIDRPNFVNEPENYYANKNISITGKVVLKNGKPQIILRDKNQISIIKQSAPAFASNTSAQAAKATVKETLVSTKAEYPGGKPALMDFIKTNLRHIEGVQQGDKITVIARFLLKKDGTATNFEIKESGGFRFDAEVMRILKKMPKWNPEIVNGEPAEIHITIPVTFMSGEESLVKLPK